MATSGDTPYPFELPDGSSFSFGIVTTQWNRHIIDPLLEGCLQTLQNAGVLQERIKLLTVPGSVELPLAAQWLLEGENLDGVICLGAVIRGDTSHFDYVCQAATNGIMDVMLKFSKPVIFGVLTVENEQQAIDRAGGKLGNKGAEAAQAVLEMAAIKRN